MPRAALFLLVVGVHCLIAAPLRFARSGDSEGGAEIQIRAGEPWLSAVRNAPLPQGTRLQTDSTGHLETETEEGTVLRLANSSLAEISDLTQLSTGQRISLFSLDHGLFYFTARPAAKDVLSIAAPGAQVTVRGRARLRFEISASTTEIAVLEGSVRFSTPTAELDIREGQLVRVSSGRTGRFQLLREIPQLESDDWSQKRDEAQEKSASPHRMPGLVFGSIDLDHAGAWIQTETSGIVWKPKVLEGWVPFQNGTWKWYDEIGYTWVSAEKWGWTPYHYGRWLQDASLGWVWIPGVSRVFKPGEVFWMRSPGLAFWGPLAPDEFWFADNPAKQYAALNITAAAFEPGQVKLDPTQAVVKPKDLLLSAKFVVALPSPALAASRLDIANPPLQPTGLGLISFAGSDVSVAGSSYEPRPLSVTPATVTPPPPPRPTTTVIIDRPVYVAVPEPVEIFYPVPVYSGVVVLNPTTVDQQKPKQGTSESPSNEPEHRRKKRIVPPEFGHPEQTDKPSGS